jgi:GDP-L-fucose synthase
VNKQAKIYVAGHNGLVGSAIMRALYADGYTHIITRTFAELDLRNQHAVHQFFAHERPEYVFLAAARVGGIKANNDYPADFMYDNLMIQNNIMHAAHMHGVKKLLFLGSSCIYPKLCPQPIKEEYLLTGPLEPTNEPYALAKIAGLKLCQAYNRQYGTQFIVAMPTNLYGPGDNFDLQSSHVVPALLAKCIQARDAKKSSVTVWGTGRVRREFLYVDDLAQALLLLMRSYQKSEWINIGAGYDVSIAELIDSIKLAVGYTGQIQFDATQPEGTPQKLLDSSKIAALGWKPSVSLEEGLARTVEWYEDSLHPSIHSSQGSEHSG